MAVCASGVLLFSNAASAAVINVNITRSTPATTAISNPDYGLWAEGDNTWNLSSSSSGSNLVDSGNNATTVGYSFTGWTNSNSNLGWGPDDLTYQGKFGDDDNTTIHNLTISQLSAGQTYELIFYFSDAFPNETMTAEGAGPDTFGESKITTGGETYVEGAAAGIFSYFNNVTADGSGNIEVLASGSGRETITGFQLRAVAVPEPSTTALLGLGGLALILRRRK